MQERIQSVYSGCVKLAGLNYSMPNAMHFIQSTFTHLHNSLFVINIVTTSRSCFTFAKTRDRITEPLWFGCCAGERASDRPIHSDQIFDRQWSLDADVHKFYVFAADRRCNTTLFSDWSARALDHPFSTFVCDRALFGDAIVNKYVTVRTMMMTISQISIRLSR